MIFRQIEYFFLRFNVHVSLLTCRKEDGLLRTMSADKVRISQVSQCVISSCYELTISTNEY